MVTSSRLRLALATFAAALLLSISAASAWNPTSPHYGAGLRVPISSLRTLTFYSGKNTAYRRTKPLPQLTCVGTPCSRYQPDVVQCQVMGDGQWKCSADLPSSLRMGRVEVSCEGYDYAEDPYVLKGSCALEYRLLPSGRGREDMWSSYDNRSGIDGRIAEIVFRIVFWGILGMIVWSFIKAIRGGAGSAGNVGAGGGEGWGGGSGGGGGGWWPGGGYPHSNPPPPPYSAKPEPDSSSSSSWRPGFWTGLGLGGLAATAAASRRRQSPYGTVPSYLNDPDYGYGGFGAGPSTFGRQTRTFGGMGRFDDDDRGGWRESTGFGGTRNR